MYLYYFNPYNIRGVPNAYHTRWLVSTVRENRMEHGILIISLILQDTNARVGFTEIYLLTVRLL